MAPAPARTVRLEAGGHPFAIRLYAPREAAGPALVWVHGGGFMTGSLDMPEADEVSRRPADSGIAVVSVGYSLAPADLLLRAADNPPDEHVPSLEQVEAEIVASGPASSSRWRPFRSRRPSTGPSPMPPS